MTLTDDRTVHTFLAQPADDPLAGLLPGALLVFKSEALWRHPDDPDHKEQWHRHEYVARITRIDRARGCLEWECARVLSETGKPPYRARSCPTAGGMIFDFFRQREWRRPTRDEADGLTTLVGDVNDFAVMVECENLRRGRLRGRRPTAPHSPAQRVTYLRKREPREAKARALSYHRAGR